MSIRIPTFPGRSRLIFAIAFGTAALFGSGAASLFAQGAPAGQAKPGAGTRTVVPASDGVIMRCGSGVAWYPVATLRPTTVLKADGEVDGWLRVDYLPGMHVVVKSEEAELNERDQKVKLTRRSRLRALSQADAVFEESFRPVFEDFLAPGIEMKYIAPLKTRSGDVGGYIVVPPPGAKGYVSAREVRDARPEDLTVAAKAPSPPVTKPVTASPQPKSQPAPTTTPQPRNPSTTPPAPVAAQPGATQPEPAAATPADEPPVDPAGAMPVESAPAPVESAPPPPPKPQGPNVRQLDRAFDELMKRPLAESDPRELIEQYNKLGDQTAGEPASERLVKYIDARVQLLRLRERAREILPEIQDLEGAQQRARENYQLTIDRLVANREYLVVGRLMPSTVYDGSRLPLMYRLISIDPSVNSTLAYIIPAEEHQLEQKIGAVVGILGDGKDEPSSMIRIITPSTVDVLRAAEGASQDAPR